MDSYCDKMTINYTLQYYLKIKINFLASGLPITHIYNICI